MVNKIFVAGHNGMVGSAIVRLLESKGVGVFKATRDEVDLLSQRETYEYFESNRFDEIYMAAAKVGGIQANSVYPADFIYENLLVQNNVIHSAWKTGVAKLLFLGSSCIYPKFAKQPIDESQLLSGELEPTNSAYAIAKISGLQLCKSYNQQYGTDFRAVMPTNLYGANDNFHEQNAHVLPALLRRVHEAKQMDSAEVVIWGSGAPRREFLHVEDMARGCFHVMQLNKATYYNSVLPEYQYFNIGTGVDVTIKQLAELVVDVVGFKGKLSFDTSRPDGTPRKLLDVSRITKVGWNAEIGLEDGIRSTYEWYIKNESFVRR